jgi:uncharacterized membrane protein
MSQEPSSAGVYAPTALPGIRKIGFADLRWALEMGWQDFMRKPAYVITLAVIYPITGLILGKLTFGYKLLPVLFPLAAGFALLGPFAALGFYEMSRQMEQGKDPSWDVFNPARFRSGAILALGVLLMLIFLVWLWTAEYIFESMFGPAPVGSLSGFLHQIFETQQGMRLIVAGNLAGFVFALISFSISVISFPLLVDRDVGAPVAILTSLKAVAENPVPMLAWATFIVAVLIVSSLPALLGLIVALPVLGHASWHLYRRVVAPEI